MRTSARLSALLALVGAVVLGAPAVASADVWPSETDNPFVEKDPPFLTPNDGEFWNPLVAKDRLTSPFGTSHRIECTSFHGVLGECWQADDTGAAVKLVHLPFNFPAVTGSALPGGGPSHYVYPGFIPGIG
ncbi:MAG: hypothetical protein GXY65_01500 [Rhodococcus sp.]|uniref:hypothetical protein n=1 Tax=Rhodococcus TaxID=1827 RepID=UPI00169A0415|nr:MULTISPECIES: hypothetical protein [Rhodococcus]NLV78019.1 hypothetical protein [Rhodococcus sp. (in: high G+C Gram-positive bacteria)]